MKKNFYALLFILTLMQSLNIYAQQELYVRYCKCNGDNKTACGVEYSELSTWKVLCSETFNKKFDEFIEEEDGAKIETEDEYYRIEIRILKNIIADTTFTLNIQNLNLRDVCLYINDDTITSDTTVINIKNGKLIIPSNNTPHGAIIVNGSEGVNAINVEGAGRIDIQANMLVKSEEGYSIKYNKNEEITYDDNVKISCGTYIGVPTAVNIGTISKETSAYYIEEKDGEENKYPISFLDGETWQCKYKTEDGEQKDALTFTVIPNKGAISISKNLIPQGCELQILTAIGNQPLYINYYKESCNETGETISEIEGEPTIVESGTPIGFFFVPEDAYYLAETMGEEEFKKYVIINEDTGMGFVLNFEENGTILNVDKYIGNRDISVVRCDTIEVDSYSKLRETIETISNDLTKQIKSYSLINLNNDVDMGGEANTDDPQNVIVTTETNFLLGTSETPFEGTFNGNGHTIRNLVSQNNDNNNSIFGNIGSRGLVKNLKIEGTRVFNTNAKLTKNDTIGFFADTLDGQIRGVCFVGDICADKALENKKIAWAGSLSDNASISSCFVYFTGEEHNTEDGNKVCVVLKQNMVVGKGRGRVYKVCQGPSNRNKSVIVNADPTTGEDYDEINKDIRECTAEQFASGEIAYWLNFDGQGYTGAYNKIWSQGEEYPILASARNSNLVKLLYVIEGTSTAEDLNAMKNYAKVGEEVTLAYTRTPEEIKIDGEAVASIGTDKTTFTVPETIEEVGIVTVQITFPATAISQVEPSASNISVKGNNVVFDNVANQHIEMYDMNGHLLISQVAQNDNMTIVVPVDGIYVVKVGSETKKIRIDK